jgi:hypothetical protein
MLAQLFYTDDVDAEKFTHQWNGPGVGIYDCIASLREGATRRSKDEVAEIIRIVSDLDLQTIEEPREEVINCLKALLLPPSEIRDSGFGLHSVWELKEGMAGALGFAQVETAMKRLAALLAGDPTPTHCAALLRRPGSDNTKDGTSRRCHVIERSGAKYDISEFDDLFDLYGEQPLLHSKTIVGNGRDPDTDTIIVSGRVDAEAELAAMQPTGASVNTVQTRVIPSLLRRAIPPAEVLETVVTATMEMAEQHDLGWTRDAEIKYVTARINSALRMIQADYDPAVERFPEWLPAEFAEGWERVLQAGGLPQLSRNLNGWYVRATPNARRIKPAQIDDTRRDAPQHRPQEVGQQSPHRGATPPPKLRFRLISFADLRPGPELLYLIDELIPAAGLVDVWGKAKCFKSFWCLDLMLHVAMGWEYRDRYVRQGAVVYCAFEGAHGYKKRIEALRRHYDIKPEAHVPLYVMPGQANLIKEHRVLIADIRAQLNNVCPAVVVLDTLNKSLFGSENKDEDMGNYVRAAEAIRDSFNCVVIIVHHCGYDDTRPRGHSSLPGAVDAQLAVVREGNVFTVTVEMMRDGPEEGVVISQVSDVSISPCVPITTPEPAEISAASAVALAMTSTKAYSIFTFCARFPG